MDDLIQQGTNALKSGDRETARKLLVAAVKQSPNNERAWGWMYNVCNTDQERIQCLKQILRINPKNDKAITLLDQLTKSETPIKTTINATSIKNAQPQVTSLKKCPFCAEEIQNEAVVCKHCGRDLIPQKQAKPKKVNVPTWRQGVKIGFVMAILSGCYSFVKYSGGDPNLLVGSLVVNPIVAFIGWSLVGTIVVWIWRQLSGN